MLMFKTFDRISFHVKYKSNYANWNNDQADKWSLFTTHRQCLKSPVLLLTLLIKYVNLHIYIPLHCRLIKRALNMIFVKNILHLDIEKRLWFVIKYINLKQTPLILKIFPSEGILNRASIPVACKQINIFIEWMNKDSIFIVNVWH